MRQAVDKTVGYRAMGIRNIVYRGRVFPREPGWRPGSVRLFGSLVQR